MHYQLFYFLHLPVLFTCGIHCYAATKAHYSFAAPQHQPFLLRLWRVINTSAANSTTTTRNLATWSHGVVTGLKQGRAFRPLCSTQTWQTAQVSTYIYQTYSVRNISVCLILRRRCGRSFDFWKDISRTAANYHILLLLPKGWMNRKTGLCWRDAKRIAAKRPQLHLKNEQYSNDQFVDQEIQIITYQPTTFLPPPHTKKTCGATAKQMLPKCWCDPGRYRCPPGDRDNYGAATP